MFLSTKLGKEKGKILGILVGEHCEWNESKSNTKRIYKYVNHESVKKKKSTYDNKQLINAWIH